MITLLTFVLVYFAGLLLIGIPMAMKSCTLIAKDDRDSVWTLLMFPLFWFFRNDGDERRGEMSVIPFDEARKVNSDRRSGEFRRAYISFSAPFWPMRLVWNVFCILLLGVVHFPVAGISALVKKIV